MHHLRSLVAVTPERVLSRRVSKQKKAAIFGDLFSLKRVREC
jgi:hypothetical protein